MSLVGSLEDLALADILQIVSLAQKSGRLVLRSGGDSGRILLRAGLVCGGVIKGERDTLRALLIEGDHVPVEQYEEASRLAEDEGLSLVSAVARVTGMETEPLEALRRGHTERSVMRMFAWVTGEFSFEVRDDIEDEDRELELASGINTQYLAMEASRLADEGFDLEGPAESVVDEVEPEFEPEDEPVGAIAEVEGEIQSVAAQSPVDALAFAAARSTEIGPEELDAHDPDSDLEAEPEPDALEVRSADVSNELGDEPPTPEAPLESQPTLETDEFASEEPAPDEAEDVCEEAVASAPAPEAESVAVAPPMSWPPVVAMDPELSGLEWLKDALAEEAGRVHIFQQAEPAVARVRQYLVRGERPVVLVSPRIDGTFEAPDAKALVARLRAMSPGMPVLELISEGRDAPGALAGATATVRRPMAPGHDPEGWFLYRPLAESLRTDIDRATRAQAPTRRPDVDVLRQLNALSQRLRNPQQEDVLSLVLEFAGETFERVAVFMVQGDRVLGMAAGGMPMGSDPAAIRDLCWSGDELPALLRVALTENRGVRGNLADPGNTALHDLLGGGAAPAYVAPIESGGCVAALLYADAGMDVALADTTALEIVLHEAGLALDRALLERTLKSARESA